MPRRDLKLQHTPKRKNGDIILRQEGESRRSHPGRKVKVVECLRREGLPVNEPRDFLGGQHGEFQPLEQPSRPTLAKIYDRDPWPVRQLAE